MTPEFWQRIRDVFDAAVELQPDARPAYLESACAGDAVLLAEVRSLLASLDDAGSFIEKPAPPPTPAAPAFPTGMDIGPYRIVQSIGEGGMGTVYQAVRVDDLYRKLVALKVIRRGMVSAAVMHKFETERHILAHLDHPNISKLLDGGTTEDGQPYFVMDFIAGTPIDQYCDENRLPIRERLKLFLTVCSAVEYSHRNFIVHRDIKPGNILVTPEGSVRLLDFGIAKLLDPDKERGGDTVSVVQMMTPEYASPEQLLNEPVTAASDTWSLGVLLYVLLTGHKPFVFASRMPQEVLRVMGESEARLPSAVAGVAETTPGGRAIVPAEVAAARGLRKDRLARELRGDLDNILLMALRRESGRRYTSVERFAADIERYLEGRPVAARRDTWSYRAGKFLRRNRAATAAGAFAVVALLAGTAATAWEARVAMRERERAERRFHDVRRMANSLLFDVHDSILSLDGSAPARRLIVTRGLEFLDNLARDASDDHVLRRELAAVYERVGDVQAQASDPAGARASYRKALVIREQLPVDIDLRRELVANLSKLSDLSWQAGEAGPATEYARRLLVAGEALVQEPGATKPDRVRLATAYLDFGYKLATLAGDRLRGGDYCRKALEMFTSFASKAPGDTRLERLRMIAAERTREVERGQ